jgi:long-chain acyl-CoA synthetase
MALATDEAQAIYMESHEPAAILYTSGTTGFPKGATLSHGNVISNMYSVNRCTKMSPEDRLLLFLPLFHCFGQNFVLNSGLNACATIVLQQRFEISAVLETIERDRITMFFGVPTVFQRLLELHPEEWTCSSLRYYFSAAAPMPPEVPQQWLSRYGAIIHEGYGLTETSPFASYNHEFKYQFGSIGMPIDNVEMKIVDLDGSETPIGKIGEIIIRGPNVMLGYWNRPQETAQVIKNGWFYTGDLGRMDEDGYFYIVDRLKDMINVSGFKVYPSEVERIIAKHPAVAEVAVYGVADQLKGEIVKANIKLKSGVVMSQKEIINFCIQNIATYKIPRDINFVESIPKNATGKVLKRSLREQ